MSVLPISTSPSLDPQKKDFLVAVYSEFHAQIRSNLDIENKVAFGVSALFMVFAAFVLRKQFGSIPLHESLAIAVFIAAAATITIRYLIKNSEQIRWQSHRIVEFKHIMGLYEIGSYVAGKPALPDEAKNWAKTDDDRFNSKQYVFGVLLATLAAISSLMVDPIVKRMSVPTTEETAIAKPKVVGDDPTHHVEVTMRPPENQELSILVTSLVDAVRTTNNDVNLLLWRLNNSLTEDLHYNTVRRNIKNLDKTKVHK